MFPTDTSRYFSIDPAMLAYQSGMTKERTGLAGIVPCIPLPFMLTDQLRGGCACQEPTQLGFVLPDGFDLGANVPSAGTGNTSILNAVAAGSAFIPGIGTVVSATLSTVNQMVSRFESWFGIGAGRREADLIVPVQNDMMQRLGLVTDQILVGQNPDLATLQGLYRQVWMQGVAFTEFVLLKTFTDRRASGQALNTVMPYIDGTCGYAVPVGATASPSQSNCLSWGDGTIGGVGTNGMLGAIGRAIVENGGSVQDLPTVQLAANQGFRVAATPPPPTTILGFSTPLAMALGVGALYLFSRKRMF